MKNALIVVMLAAACGGKKSETKAEDTAAKKPTDTTTCPMPRLADSKERFAVGSIPVARVEGLYHGARCHDMFVANDVVKAEGESYRVVAEGTFQGHCKDEPDNKRTYEAVKPAQAIVQVNALATSEGELGFGKPVFLDSKTPDKMGSVKVGVADRCGTQLEGLGEATWEPGAGCDKVAKLVPWTLSGPANPKAAEMQIAAVGPGTCTINVTMFGAKGDVTVTVK